MDRVIELSVTISKDSNFVPKDTIEKLFTCDAAVGKEKIYEMMDAEDIADEMYPPNDDEDPVSDGEEKASAFRVEDPPIFIPFVFSDKEIFINNIVKTSTRAFYVSKIVRPTEFEVSPETKNKVCVFLTPVPVMGEILSKILNSPPKLSVFIKPPPEYIDKDELLQITPYDLLFEYPFPPESVIKRTNLGLRTVSGQESICDERTSDVEKQVSVTIKETQMWERDPAFIFIVALDPLKSDFRVVKFTNKEKATEFAAQKDICCGEIVFTE